MRSRRQMWDREIGRRDLMVGIILANIAEVQLARGHQGRAEELYAESLAIREERLGAEHPMVVVPLVGLANIAISRGKVDDAVLLARRAVVVAEGRSSELTIARAQEALARALSRNESSRRDEVDELVARASQAFERAGPLGEDDLERLASWWPSDGKGPRYASGPRGRERSPHDPCPEYRARSGCGPRSAREARIRRPPARGGGSGDDGRTDRHR